MRTIGALLLASTALTVARPALAQDATWVGGDAFDPSGWLTSANWTPTTVPSGTAIFDTSATTTVSVDGMVSVDAITFTAGSSTYAITTNDVFTITGIGVTNNNTGATQTFNVFSALLFNSGSASTGPGAVTYNNSAAIIFNNASTAGNAAINNNNEVDFNGTSTAGTATISNTLALNFNNASSADHATITNSSGALLTFNDSAKAGSALITNDSGASIQFRDSSNAESAQIANSGTLSFAGTSNAGSAILNNLSGATLSFDGSSSAAGAQITNDGTLAFTQTSTAGSATISNNSGATLSFNNGSSAASAQITNDGALSFADTSTAGAATITNNVSMTFNGSSKAGTASITNNWDLNFNNQSSAQAATIINNSFLTFNDTSTAGTAKITNNDTTTFAGNSTTGGATIVNNGLLSFVDSASANGATITTTNGGATSFNDSSIVGNAVINTMDGGVTFFATSATAGTATITNTGTSVNPALTIFVDSSAGSATIVNNAYGATLFFGTSTAGQATITSNADGGTAFADNSTGGNARFIINAGGFLDFSGSAGPAGDGKLTAGSIEGAGKVFLGNELTVGSNNLNTVFSGVISECGCFPGSLVKTGTGTLTLSGINTYTGATTVNAGTLQVDGSIAASSGVTVNSGGVLAGSGIVSSTTVNDGGAIMPGSLGAPGTLTVQGSLVFSSAAIYVVQVSTSAVSRINVNGTASLGGTTLATIAAGFSMPATYIVLSATGGVSGTFASFNTLGLAPSLRATLSYDANDVYLTFAYAGLTPLLAPGANANQRAVANAIDAAIAGGGTPTGGFITLLGLQGQALGTALTQASGETATGVQQTSFNAMNLFMGALTDPFSVGRGGTASPGASPFAEDGAGNAYASSRKPSAARDALAMYTKAPLAQVYEPRWSVWASGFGGTQTTDGNAVVGSNTATSRIFGTAVGFDYRFSPNTIAGVALAGGGTNFSVANGGTGRSDLFQAGAFVRHTVGPTYITAALAYGWQDVTTNRTVTIAGADQLQARFNANTFAGRVEGGYRFVTPWLGGLGLTPYAAGQFTTVDLPAYAESAISGSNAFALNYGSKSVTDTRSELGLRADKSFALTDSILTLRGRAAWAHDFAPNRAVAATFQTLPGASFVVNGAAQARDSALTTASAELKWLNGFSVAATFEGEFSDVTRSYAGKGTVRYTW